MLIAMTTKYLVFHLDILAFEDDYNEEYINEVFENLDGRLYYVGKYGYKINQ